MILCFPVLLTFTTWFFGNQINFMHSNISKRYCHFFVHTSYSYLPIDGSDLVHKMENRYYRTGGVREELIFTSSYENMIFFFGNIEQVWMKSIVMKIQTSWSVFCTYQGFDWISHWIYESRSLFLVKFAIMHFLYLNNISLIRRTYFNDKTKTKTKTKIHSFCRRYWVYSVREEFSQRISVIKLDNWNLGEKGPNAVNKIVDSVGEACEIIYCNPIFGKCYLGIFADNSGSDEFKSDVFRTYLTSKVHRWKIYDSLIHVSNDRQQ